MGCLVVNSNGVQGLGQSVMQQFAEGGLLEGRVDVRILIQQILKAFDHSGDVFGDAIINIVNHINNFPPPANEEWRRFVLEVLADRQPRDAEQWSDFIEAMVDDATPTELSTWDSFLDTRLVSWVIAQGDYSAAGAEVTVGVKVCDDRVGANPTGAELTCLCRYTPDQDYPNVRQDDVFRAFIDPSGGYDFICETMNDIPIGDIVISTDAADGRLSRGYEIVSQGKFLVGYSGSGDYTPVGNPGGYDAHGGDTNDHDDHSDHTHGTNIDGGKTPSTADAVAGKDFAALTDLSWNDPVESEGASHALEHSSTDNRPAFEVVVWLKRTS